MSGPGAITEYRWWDRDPPEPFAPKTPSARRIAVRDPLFKVIRRLTARDREICRLLFDHKVLTIHQIHQLFFDDPRRTRRRMLELYGMGLVIRFRPYRPTGSAPYHYVLGELGLELVGAERDIEDKKLRIRFDRINKLSKSQRLRHQLEVNDFFCKLAFASRGTDLRLVEWRNEEYCAAHAAWNFTPDGLGAVQSPQGLTRFFLELDRGTEDHARLHAKVERYSMLRVWERGPWLVLFVFPSRNRESFARKALFDPGITIATTSRDWLQQDILGCIWLPVTGADRVSLPDLAEGGGIVTAGVGE